MHYQAASLTQVIEGGDVSFVHSDTRAGSTRREPHAPKSPTAEARTPADMAGHNIPLTAAKDRTLETVSPNQGTASRTVPIRRWPSL